MRCHSPAEDTRSDRGATTAEFAVVLPAVVLVLIVALGAIQLVGMQVRVQAAAAGAARSLGRGDAAGAQSAIADLPAAVLTASTWNDLICASVGVPGGIGAVGGFTISATSCALSDGQ